MYKSHLLQLNSSKVSALQLSDFSPNKDLKNDFFFGFLDELSVDKEDLLESLDLEVFNLPKEDLIFLNSLLSSKELSLDFSFLNRFAGECFDVDEGFFGASANLMLCEFVLNPKSAGLPALDGELVFCLFLIEDGTEYVFVLDNPLLFFPPCGA